MIPVSRSPRARGRFLRRLVGDAASAGRLVGYTVWIALWLLGAVPLALLSSDEGGGADVAAIYLETSWDRSHEPWSLRLADEAAVLVTVAVSDRSGPSDHQLCSGKRRGGSAAT
jgi:hypothetical protein